MMLSELTAIVHKEFRGLGHVTCYMTQNDMSLPGDWFGYLANISMVVVVSSSFDNQGSIRKTYISNHRLQ